MRNLPFRDFEHNRVWLELVRIAHDLLTWTQRLLLTGVVDAVQMALAHRRPQPGLICHTDQGPQPGLNGASQHRVVGVWR